VLACIAFANSNRVLVEPSCGAALATAEKVQEDSDTSAKIVVVACGGTNISLEKLSYYERLTKESL